MSEPRTKPVALVRCPEPNLDAGLTTMADRQPVDVELALAQWHAHNDVLAECGWSVETVAPASGCADSVFIEDAAVVFDDIAMVALPGAVSRRPEVDAVASDLRSRGIEMFAIEAPGTLDGGDVLKVGSTVFVGHGHRTNAVAIEQLRSILEPRGKTIVAIANRSALHLKSAVTALPDGTVIGWPPALDDQSAFPGLVPMPEEAGAHVVDLGNRRLLISATAPRSAELLAARGWTPVPVEISEFEKLEGCVTCLSIRLR